MSMQTTNQNPNNQPAAGAAPESKPAEKMAEKSPQTPAQMVGKVNEGMKEAQQAGAKAMEQGKQVMAQGKEVAQGMQKLGASLMASTSGKQLQPNVKQDEKVYAAVAYLPLLAIACIMFKPDSSYVRLHGRQGLMLFILFFITLILTAIVAVFPVIGPILGFLFGLIPFALMLIGIYSIYLALTGYWWKIPLIGQMAEIIPVEAFAQVAKQNLAGQVTVAKEDLENRQETMKKEAAEKKAEPNQSVAANSSNASAAKLEEDSTKHGK